MRRNKRRVRQQPLPLAADLDQILAVGPIAVQEHDQVTRRARTRIEPRAVELSGHPILHWVLSAEAAPLRD